MALVSNPVPAHGIDASRHRPDRDGDADSGPPITVQRVDGPAQRRAELLAGLRREDARLSPKFFYDAQGCALYEAICRLPEYYPPATEASILERHAPAIAAALPEGCEWVDLGCGDGLKAWRWIETLDVRRYLGVDIARDWLRQTLQRGARRFPAVEFAGVATDFTRGLDLREALDDRLPRVFFYPGSSIGNFDRDEAVRLLSEIRAHLRPQDRLLLGADAPKDLPVLLAAYDDALGVTAAFNLNVLRVINAELGSDFRPQDFLHRAVYDEPHQRIEMHLVARHDVTVRLAGDLRRVFRAGEHIVTEHSHKYAPAAMQSLLAEAGYGDVRHWTDERRWYGVYVAAPGGTVQ